MAILDKFRVQHEVKKDVTREAHCLCLILTDMKGHVKQHLQEDCMHRTSIRSISDMAATQSQPVL